jgi:NAD(P)-dependent dehydrogenase (short-subunit alcohol dehydrogenase family)
MYRKQILITGATNGIGLAAAEALVALGANVTIERVRRRGSSSPHPRRTRERTFPPTT